MRLFPPPQSVVLQNEFRALPIHLALAENPYPTARFAKTLSALDIQIAETRTDATFQLTHNPELPSQGYRILVSKSEIHLKSGGEVGALYGLQTLTQILQNSTDRLQCLAIQDQPDLEVRGFMLDISRCKVPTLSSLFELVNTLSRLRYNQFQLYTEHTFAYQQHPTVWQNASPLSASEVQQLDSYCNDRYIELVPNQNTFGHMERWLRHPAYQHLAESPNGFLHPLAGWKTCGSTLKPDSASLAFIESLLLELLPNFSSNQVNIGGDEPWELGQGASKKRVETLGKHEVYLEHLLKIHSIVAGQNRKMQFWGDIVLERPDLVSQLPQDVTALLWGYEKEHPFPEQCALMAESGIEHYVVPGTSTWNSLSGRASNARINILSATENAIRSEARGILLTEWGDNGHHQSHLLARPQLLLASAASWNFQATGEIELSSFAELVCPSAIYRAIEQYGALSDCFEKPLHNGTWLNKTLFALPENFESIRNSITQKELRDCQAQLQQIPHLQPLATTRALVEFAVSKSLSIVREDSLPHLPASLVALFQEDWLRVNRPGGLEESVENLLLPNRG